MVKCSFSLVASCACCSALHPGLAKLRFYRLVSEKNIENLLESPKSDRLPATSKKDLNEKFQLYEKHGVKEYWIVDPGNRYFRIFHLLKGGNSSGKYDEGTLVSPEELQEVNNTIAESEVL